MMNYQTLFHQADALDHNDDFRFMCYPLGGETQLQSRSRYPMLFVLEGFAELRFKYRTCPIEAGNLVVFTTDQLLSCTTAPGTIVLIYRPPYRLAYFLEQSNKIFDAPHSELVPILPPLQEWIDTLVEKRDEELREQRCQLAHIFMQNYPRRQLGELYVPFSACMQGNCKQCQIHIGHTDDVVIG